MNIFDKYVMANLKLIQVQVATIITSYILVGILGNMDLFFNPGLTLVFPICLIVIEIQYILAYKKLFYDSIYGKSANLYNQLPVNSEETVFGKLLVIGFLHIIPLPIILIIVKLSGDILALSEDLSMLSEITEPFPMIYSVVRDITTAGIVLFAVIFYNSIPKVKRTTFKLVQAVLIVLVLDQINSNIVGALCLHINFQTESVLLVVKLIVSAIVFLITTKLSIKMLNERLEL